MDIVNKILDMVAHWPPIGQGAFFLVGLIVTATVVLNLTLGLVRYFVVLFRGWPSEARVKLEAPTNGR